MLCVCVICTSNYVYLIAHINISLFGEQQGHEVHTALLCSEVEGADALTGHCVALRPIFQQRCPNLQLILLSCNMKRCVAILERMREKHDEKQIWIFFLNTMQACNHLFFFFRPSTFECKNQSGFLKFRKTETVRSNHALHSPQIPSLLPWWLF